MASQTRTFSLFPMEILPRLRRGLGGKWARLVESIAEQPETSPKHMAYTLVMRRLAYQIGSGAGDLCFAPSCVICALDILEHYQGSELDLMEEYRRTLAEVENFVAGLEQLSIAA